MDYLIQGWLSTLTGFISVNLGSIQEDRHKVEQFHNLWNSVPKMWNSSPKSGTGPEIGLLFHKLWNSSTICGTAPAKSGTGTINSTTKVTNGMLFEDVIQCIPSYAYHMEVDRHTNYHSE